MARFDERLAFVEGRVTEHARSIDGIRDALVHLEQRMDARFAAVDLRFDSIDRRFEAIDRRFEAIDRRFEAIDRRFDSIDRRFAGVDGRIGALEAQSRQQFMWIVGIQLTTTIAIVVALLAR